MPYITLSYLHRLASLEKKHGNGPKEATNLDRSYWEIKGVLGIMEDGGIRLRWGTRTVPTVTTYVHHTARPNQHLHR